MTLHPSLPRNLPDDRPVALLIRHAERPPLDEKGDLGMSLSLTDQGQRDARELGAHLGGRIVLARTSVVRRCVQTATAILEGAGRSLAPVEDPAIGMPSTFFRPGPEAERTMRSLGFSRFNAHLMSGDTELPGVLHPAEGARLLREHALASLTATSGLHLLVTHDAMIAATVARSWREVLEDAQWPRFLEAAALWLEDGKAMLSYRERCKPVC